MVKRTTFVDVAGRRLDSVKCDIIVSVGEHVTISCDGKQWRGQIVRVHHSIQIGKNDEVVHETTVRVEEQ